MKRQLILSVLIRIKKDTAEQVNGIQKNPVTDNSRCNSGYLHRGDIFSGKGIGRVTDQEASFTHSSEETEKKKWCKLLRQHECNPRCHYAVKMFYRKIRSIYSIKENRFYTLLLNTTPILILKCRIPQKGWVWRLHMLFQYEVLALVVK